MAARQTLSLTPDISDPYPVYRQLRESSPFRYADIEAGTIPGVNEPVYSWALMKHADLSAALQDHASFSSERLPLIEKGLVPRFMLQADDPPRHTRFRRLLTDAFTPKRVKALEPWMTDTANGLIDSMGRGEVEVVAAYTVPFPIQVVARLLGVPHEDYRLFRKWSDAALSTTSRRVEERKRSLEELRDYFGVIAAKRRARGEEDLITALIQAEIEGQRLTEEEVLGFCLVLLVAGIDTTTHLMSNMLGLLAHRPELWQQLRSNRSLVVPVVEETLRYESPVQRLSRVATRDVNLSGVTIPQGEMVSLFFGAANRDPAVFSNPDEFHLDRDHRKHLGFGHGIHFCIGAPLARSEAQITLNAFLDRFSILTPGAGPAVRQTENRSRFGFQQLSLSLQA